MGRKPIGKRAMTDAERQVRRRKKLRKSQTAEQRKKARLMAREKERSGFAPAPPGITYYEEITVSPDEERDVFTPVTRPLASCESQLEDDEISVLLDQLHHIAHRRGIQYTPPPAPQESEKTRKTVEWVVRLLIEKAIADDVVTLSANASILTVLHAIDPCRGRHIRDLADLTDALSGVSSRELVGVTNLLRDILRWANVEDR